MPATVGDSCDGLLLITMSAIIAMVNAARMLPTTIGSSGTPDPLLTRTGGRRPALPLPKPAESFARDLVDISGQHRPGSQQVGAGGRKAAGQNVETKEGVAQGGAQPALRDDA